MLQCLAIMRGRRCPVKHKRGLLDRQRRAHYIISNAVTVAMRIFWWVKTLGYFDGSAAVEHHIVQMLSL